MILFIWEEVDDAGYHYHSTGGCVAVAKDIASSREMLKEKGADIREDEHPDYTCELLGCTEERAWVMPNAGCC